MGKRPRRNYSPTFQAEVALDMAANRVALRCELDQPAAARGEIVARVVTGRTLQPSAVARQQCGLCHANALPGVMSALATDPRRARRLARFEHVPLSRPQ
jgi:hypothetical protein